jgi:hypothetical protein
VGIQSEALDALAMRLKDERDALRSEGGLEIPEEEDLPPELRERLEALEHLETSP